jgi:CspA family cold shock protein
VKKLKKGIVKSWICDRGYGFIETKKENRQIFVHRTDLRGATYLTKGEKVEFKIKETKRGPKAIDVKPIFSSAF